MNICVFCSSSDAAPKKYFISARKLGEELVKNGFNLVYGGANRGLMKEIAAAVKEKGGRVTGVIPRSLKELGIAREGLDELIITTDLRERKKVMESRSAGFVFLPGGTGTLEEAMEIITLKQLHAHDKPLVFLNVAGFYDRLMKFFRQMEKEKFVKKDLFKMFFVAKDEKVAVKYLKQYRPSKTGGKWF